LPKQLGDKARLVLFEGRDVQDFAWHGGEFRGHVFDPARRENSWEPNANTRIIVITTSPGGVTSDLLFRDIKSDCIAGAVVTVEGAAKRGSEVEVATFAERVCVESCTLLRSGKFMWDYGHLWQILIWPEDYEPWEVERAQRYFRNDLVRDSLQMEAGDDRVRFDNTKRPIEVSRSDEPNEAVCFFGGPLPKNIARGRQYFVVASSPEFIKIAEQVGGLPIRFEGTSDGSRRRKEADADSTAVIPPPHVGGYDLQGVKLMFKLSGVYHGLYAPTGSGPGKGGVDVQCCRDVRITGCQLSALGDTMHVQRSRNVIFANNHIIGSRMGAFFLAEFCKNASITGNLVDGTNGSRVMSVEKSCADVTITGNTFRNGGRGAWINQPRNFILQGNVFVNNTTKGERDPRRGRRGFATGDYQRFPELYFTLHQTNGTYGPVIVRDNIFATSDSCAPGAVTFAPNGHDLQMSGNVFQGPAATIRVDTSCTGVVVRDNPGATLKREPVGFNEGRR